MSHPTGDEMNGFTVFVLLYGDHLELARRSLGSIAYNCDPALCRSIRVGMNAVSDRSRAAALELLTTIVPAGVETLVYDAGPHNRLKYPMMRKMFNDPKHRVVTPHTMWFDDDSCIDPDTDYTWWRRVYDRMQQADMIGKLYTFPVAPRQRQAIEAQPWYTGKLVPGKFTFATGGWWACRTKHLQRWDYPFRQLTHNGGDTVLGELMRQQGLSLRNFSEGVWINADEHGNASKAPRRGESRKPLWYNYPADEDTAAYHAFKIEAVDPNAGEWWVGRPKSEVIGQVQRTVDQLGRQYRRRPPQVPGL